MFFAHARAARPRWRLGVVVLGSLLHGNGCGGAQRNPPPIDCAAADAYEVRVLEDYEDGSMSFIGFADSTPGAIQNVQIGVIDNGGRCGSELSVVLLARGNRD